MARRFRGRLSARDQIILTNKADAFYAAMAGKEPMFQREVKPKRLARVKPETSLDIDAIHRKREVPLEKKVLADVLHALRHDPRVAHVERTQSGLLQDGDRYIRVGFKGKLDITGFLQGGRYFEIECKRPGGKPDPRQAERIATIKANGGISGYCWSAESALALLP